MEVPTYTFQSPYPSAIQVGRAEPQPFKQDDSKKAVDALSQAGNTSLKDAQTYKLQSNLSSVNVAESSTNPAVSSSLEAFSSLNGQLQANQAYTNS